MCVLTMTGDLASKLKGYDDDETEEEDEDEDEDEMMAVEGSDGQQYVVLEVIQLADSQGGGQVRGKYLILFKRQKLTFIVFI